MSFEPGQDRALTDASASRSICLNFGSPSLLARTSTAKTILSRRKQAACRVAANFNKSTTRGAALMASSEAAFQSASDSKYQAVEKRACPPCGAAQAQILTQTYVTANASVTSQILQTYAGTCHHNTCLGSASHNNSRFIALQPVSAEAKPLSASNRRPRDEVIAKQLELYAHAQFKEFKLPGHARTYFKTWVVP